jgi:hypothetical protein
MGRSAILLGDHLRAGETFTVCDLFDSDAPDDENSGEMRMSYRSTLTRKAFDANYLAFHDELPTVVQAPTFVLADGRLTPKSARFVHVDASHLYEHVIGDIKVAREALAPEGIVVLDDYRAEHTPGVAAAAWEAVATMGLKPIVLSGTKMYATWGDLDIVQEELVQDSKTWTETVPTVEAVAGRRLLRLRGLPSMQAPPFRHSRFYDEIQTAKAAEAEEKQGRREQEERAAAEQRAIAARTPSRVAKRVAKELLPPVATRAVVSALNARRGARAGH